MKNYRTVELPDCCGVCAHKSKHDICRVAKFQTLIAFVSITGLCDNFARCVSQNAKSETQDDLRLTDETQTLQEDDGEG